MSSKKDASPERQLPLAKGMGRRPFLIGSIATLGVAALGAGCTKFFPPNHPVAEAIDLTRYAPVSFDKREWQFLLAVCDRLIPSDSEGPGALETNVPVFIDRQMQTSYGKGDDWYMDGPHDPHASTLFGYQMPFNLHTLYRRGIAVTNRYTEAQFGQAFADLTPTQQDAVIGDFEKNRIDFAQYGETDLNASYFLFRLLDNTKEGYLADPQYGGNKDMAAWLMINFPGARASFPDWITQHNVVYPLKPVSLDGTQA